MSILGNSQDIIFICILYMYPLIPYKEIEKLFPEMEREKVSEVARGKTDKTGFLEVYKKYGSNLPEYWKIKRDNFIKRTLVQYNKKPTYRRYLALIAWAYQPIKK